MLIQDLAMKPDAFKNQCYVHLMLFTVLALRSYHRSAHPSHALYPRRTLRDAPRVSSLCARCARVLEAVVHHAARPGFAGTEVPLARREPPPLLLRQALHHAGVVRVRDEAFQLSKVLGHHILGFGWNWRAGLKVTESEKNKQNTTNSP